MIPSAPRWCRAVTIFLALVHAGLAATDPAPPKKEEPLALPKMAVTGTAVCSFGIGVAGVRDPRTKRVSRLFITEVADDTPAARAGLREGDEILSINGKKVLGMDGEIKSGSELFELLVNQYPGRTIEIEVAVRTVRKMTLTAISP
jgi:C-terminal processing protease CtpA/Prc